MASLLALLGLATVCSGQTLGPTAETNPSLPTKMCTAAGGCMPMKTFLTLDMFGRNVTSAADPTKSCVGSVTDLQAICNTTAACATSCVMQGADYDAAGVVVSANSFSLKLFHKNASGALVPGGPKVYILDETGEKYAPLKLGTELTFDVDLSTVPCGAVSAVVAQEMDLAGGKSAMNPGGAKYGGGYCNAQCNPGLTFANGMANVNASGVCCAEVDIFHSNSRATQAAPHPCGPPGTSLCSSAQGNCKDDALPLCDRHGCGMKPYKNGAPTYYGRGKNFTVDTSRPFTVVTQFVAGSAAGTWGGMKRMYIQDGKLIDNFANNGTTTPLVIASDYCSATNPQMPMDELGNFTRLGGLDQVAKSLTRGMVVSWAIWTSPDFANWLDADANGPCNATEGDIAPMLAASPDPGPMVKYSDIRMGEIGSTYKDKVGSTLGMTS